MFFSYNKLVKDMKKVGVLMRKMTTEGGHDGFLLYKGVSDYLLKNNVLPLGFMPPIINGEIDKKILKKMLKKFDGVILEGGDDFDDFDLEIVRYLYLNDIPCLGICLGMQMMGCLFNGFMADIKGHMQNDKYAHFVYLNKNSKLYKILKKRKILVNSRHQSAVMQTNLKVCAYSDVIEAVSDDNKKFFIGVQWHPENLDDINSYKLFQAFFKALKKN